MNENTCTCLNETSIEIYMYYNNTINNRDTKTAKGENEVARVYRRHSHNTGQGKAKEQRLSRLV